MKLKMYKKPNPIKVFEKVSKLKKLLKTIKVENNDKFIEKLLYKPTEILNIISEGYSLEDYNHINLDCTIKCNIPIEFNAQIGDGSNCWIIAEMPDGTSLHDPDTDNRKGLIEILENIILPNLIVFTEIELKQAIKNSRSEFKYELVE